MNASAPSASVFIAFIASSASAFLHSYSRRRILLKRPEMSIVYMDISGSEGVLKKSVIARRMIQEVKEALKTQSPATVSAGFPDYQKEFPTLFGILINPNPDKYPDNVLEMMLSKLEEVEAGSVSRHDASVSVGSALVNQFVKPNLAPR